MINNFVEHFQLSSVWKRNGDLDGMEEKFEKLGNCLILSPVSTLARGFRIIFNVKSRIRRICRICYSFIHCSFSCEYFLRTNPFFFFLKNSKQNFEIFSNSCNKNIKFLF